MFFSCLSVLSLFRIIDAYIRKTYNAFIIICKEAERHGQTDH